MVSHGSHVRMLNNNSDIRIAAMLSLWLCFLLLEGLSHWARALRLLKLLTARPAWPAGTKQYTGAPSW